MRADPAEQVMAEQEEEPVVVVVWPVGQAVHEVDWGDDE
jgi:hypothetical protein